MEYVILIKTVQKKNNGKLLLKVANWDFILVVIWLLRHPCCRVGLEYKKISLLLQCYYLDCVTVIVKYLFNKIDYFEVIV